MTTALTQRTPANIDTELAALDLAGRAAQSRVAAAIVGLHRALGERPVTTRANRQTWPTTSTEALAKVEATVAAGTQDSPWTKPNAALAAYNATTAEVARIAAEAAPLNAEFARRGGWSRFFVVQQSNGHIHSSMTCSTCNNGRQATQFGWNPQLSGLTEAEAVAQLGPSLCTVCFPSAPVEWTVGRVARKVKQG